MSCAIPQERESDGNALDAGGYGANRVWRISEEDDMKILRHERLGNGSFSPQIEALAAKIDALAVKWAREAEELDTHPEGHEDFRYGKIIQLRSCIVSLREIYNEVLIQNLDRLRSS